MIVGNTFYKSYPRIRQEDIGTNTSNLFIDSLNISNLYLDGIGGDYELRSQIVVIKPLELLEA